MELQKRSNSSRNQIHNTGTRLFALDFVNQTDGSQVHGVRLQKAQTFPDNWTLEFTTDFIKDENRYRSNKLSPSFFSSPKFIHFRNLCSLMSGRIDSIMQQQSKYVQCSNKELGRTSTYIWGDGYIKTDLTNSPF